MKNLQDLDIIGFAHFKFLAINYGFYCQFKYCSGIILLLNNNENYGIIL